MAIAQFSLRIAWLVLLYGACQASATAQIAIVDVMGKPIMAEQYVDVKGSPYLFEDWVKGSVLLTDGTMHEGVELLYDQVEDQLIRKGEQGQAQLFSKPVAEFRLQGKTFRRGFTPVDGASALSFYEVLADGEAQLLKRAVKAVFEERPYGSATIVKTIQEKTFYYVATSDKLVKVKKDKQSLVASLNGKPDEVTQYIKDNRLKLKEEADMVKLVSYYNSLH